MAKNVLLASFGDADKYPDVDGAVGIVAYNIITRADGGKIFLREKLRAMRQDDYAEPKTAEQIAAEYRALLNAGKK